MLTRLSIQNVVLIDRLDLSAGQGLIALTGETGAGKSIILDALGLALGMRAEARLVRTGTDAASVTASFDLELAHPVFDVLRSRDMVVDDTTLILRRTLGSDGRSKAFINDQPVSAQLLKEAGAALVEIHGQFETQGLLDSSTHRTTLDVFAGLIEKTAAVSKRFTDWQNAATALREAKEQATQAQQQEEFLRYAVEELQELAPQAGEEQELAQLRQRLLTQEKRKGVFDTVAAAVSGDDGLLDMIGKIEQMLSRTDDTAAQDILRRLKAEAEDLSWHIEKKSGGDEDPRSLPEIEERYFALKECARKHRVTVDELPQLLQDLSQRLQLATDQDRALEQLQKNVTAKRADYFAVAQDLSTARHKAAAKLEKAVNAELPDLKLERAKVEIKIDTATNDTGATATGIDHVQFMVSTNPGSAAGPLGKVASGGEMGRMMLAIKAVLSAAAKGQCMIFDEVDSGIGGATAAAVGERLKRLSASGQILVVTHSPQVAAVADHHWRVAKKVEKSATRTTVDILAQDERREEIARMLSGAAVTAEARAQAEKLLSASASEKPVVKRRVQK